MSVYIRSCPRRRVNERNGENPSTVAGAYKVLCREKIPGNEWISQDTAMSTEITLAGHTRQGTGILRGGYQQGRRRPGE
uniref:Uncharacterized protein n=1 Tax=Candidatus Kentrum sp. FW TaxID=2126338 RepID=A0A450TM79_9GAMM|nr:MAG: hypothetical protein BECKFW1821C_GA0114237_101642 [Candidatus Kentron sp. FW]